MTPQQIVMTQPDDWHLHLRDGEMLSAVLPYTARQFARAIVMPNLKPPVTTVKQATEYAQRIRAALAQRSADQNTAFDPLMTLYLTDHTSADEIKRARDSGIVQAVKLYPAGATTNSDSGVTDLNQCTQALEAMQKNAVVLCIHGEVTHQDVDVFDREAVFIDQVLIPLRHRFPELRIVLEHITTRQAVDYVQSASGPIAATITPQHLPGRNSASLLLPASAQARSPSAGAVGCGHQRKSEVFSWNRQRSPRAGHQGDRLWLRRMLFCALRLRTLRPGIRVSGCFRSS
jgi:dihydroorotase